jgi:hypothetical protein
MNLSQIISGMHGEQVTTKEVTEYLRRFFDAYLATVIDPGDPRNVA